MIGGVSDTFFTTGFAGSIGVSTRFLGGGSAFGFCTGLGCTSFLTVTFLTCCTGSFVSTFATALLAGNVTNSISTGVISFFGAGCGLGVLITAKATAVSTCSPTTTRRDSSINLVGGVSKSVELITA